MGYSVRDLVFNRVSSVVSCEVPGMKRRIEDLKKEIQETEAALIEANNLVDEACEQFGFEVKEFSFEQGGAQLVKKEVPL